MEEEEEKEKFLSCNYNVLRACGSVEKVRASFIYYNVIKKLRSRKLCARL